ncbi:MAG: catalase/peroxidase HPI, partial [Halieaceae bacterium]|nr:catalase/peroxidase HPI [Halieaceae bacterium]
MLKKAIPLVVAAAVGSSAMLSSAASHAAEAKTNQFWWPDRVELTPLRNHATASNPYADDFDYAAEFSQLDLAEVKKDIENILTTSQDWWPADYGHYGPFMIRMTWHAAGTYRVADGRGGAEGGQQRFEPLNSWPDNGNLDKARRLLWPVKEKYGRALSWGDLMVLAGNVAMESMGFKTYGYAGGRIDDWEADLVYWGPEKVMLGDERYSGDRKLESPLAAVQMGLIYVNPEGPNGNPDPLQSARDVRETFGRMAMNDEETVALVAGGHAFGKMHGAHKPEECLSAEPGGAGVEEQGLGWKNSCGKGHSEDTVTSGLEGAWTVTPARWSINYLQNLFAFEWKQVKSPAGATQWIPTDPNAANMVPDAHLPNVRHAPVMTTADLALKADPAYREIAKRFLDNPEEFELAFAKAWFKLLHRDMGPSSRYLGAEAPTETLIWQDPVPEADYDMISARDIRRLKNEIVKSELSNSQLVKAAWASASTYRDTDKRGGANGARIRLEPLKDWPANDPDELDAVLDELEDIQEDFNESNRRKQVSLADLIVLGGAVGIERAAAEAGYDIEVPFIPGRTDATAEMTDVDSFRWLEPVADGFRNYYDGRARLSPAAMLIDKADTLALTVPEMTVLVGGMRALDANTGGSRHGIFTDRPGSLTNDFFANLLSMDTQWRKSKSEDGIYEGVDRSSGEVKWTATPVDLVFGSHSELRA